MRNINLIIVHCSASDAKVHDNIEIIDQWHKERGFLRRRIPANSLNKENKSVGYHYVILKDGEIIPGRDESEIGAHCEGVNLASIGICLTGLNEFSEEQFDSLIHLIRSLLDKYNLEPKDILPHYALNKHKSCPNFDLNDKIISKLYN
jgi:N-acetyl-anhydromuramyl-L-alanine amidase AmpD